MRVTVVMDLNCFSRNRDLQLSSAGYKRSESREALERATGVCLGRSAWTGRGTFHLTPEQFCKLYIASRTIPHLKDGLDAATVLMPDPDKECVFYGKGLNA